MTARSYSPHGIAEPNPDYQTCCGLYHATSAAKFFSCYYFIICLITSAINFVNYGFDKFWISMFCVAFTVYTVAIMYGVMMEKKCVLVPFLIVQGLVVLVLLVSFLAYACVGIFTDGIREHHRDAQPLRDLYKMHDLDPDDSITQTVAASSFLFFLLFHLGLSGYAWYVMWLTFKCYRDNDRTLCPGYQKGIVANEEL